MTQIDKAKSQPSKSQSGKTDKIERVGAGGEVGQGQAGVPLHKPQGRRDRELGERERVGAGGPIGEERFDRS
jgi:hypothetical protein